MAQKFWEQMLLNCYFPLMVSLQSADARLKKYTVTTWSQLVKSLLVLVAFAETKHFKLSVPYSVSDNT